MAVSFLTDTSLLETVFRKLDICFLVSIRENLIRGSEDKVSSVEEDETVTGFWALIASSFVILPPTPVPATDSGEIPFSAKILAAAGEGCPEA